LAGLRQLAHPAEETSSLKVPKVAADAIGTNHAHRRYRQQERAIGARMNAVSRTRNQLATLRETGLRKIAGHL
jgi:hypothetical protein